MSTTLNVNGKSVTVYVPDDPLVFVAIGTDGAVTITCHRQDMGQGVRTSLPMVVADEMEADWSCVRVKQARGDEARFGNQGTDGLRSVRHAAVSANPRCRRSRPRYATPSLARRASGFAGCPSVTNSTPDALLPMRSTSPRRHYHG